MLQLLFVDDERNVLDGLKRTLRPMREQWAAEFVDSGTEALERFAQHPFDVLVTDMRMPVMDGPQLLREIERRYPSVVRIVLSGHCVEEDIMRTVGPAHQFLTKPCNMQVLRDAIDRACALQEAICNTAVREVVAQVHTLPSLPRLFEEVVAELSSPGCSMQQVGAIIEKDVAMTAKVLQMVNSAFFGLAHRVTSPSQAVTLLGQNTIKALVLGAGVFSQFTEMKMPGLSLSQFIDHCTAVGVLAAKIASAESDNLEQISAAQLAGMVHDVGKLVLASANVLDYGDVEREARDKDLFGWQVERTHVGACHAEVGGYLLGLWGLPTPVVEAVAFHHEPSRSPARQFVPLCAVHFANRWYETPHDQRESGRLFLDTEFLTRAKLDGRIAAWRGIARKLDETQGRR